MLITVTSSGHNRDGEPFARGLFLILMQRESDIHLHAEIRAVVRTVTLRPLGNWMMGKARIGGGHVESLSGDYGGDGLPCTVPDSAFERGIPLPPELVEAWRTGGGHNSAGNEAPAMQEWALTNLDRLRAPHP